MRLSTILVAIALLAAPHAGLAQALPHHADPSARDIQPDMSGVAAIRFLTTADFPPFNYRDASGELVGFNVDLARALCTELEVACTIQAWPWEQAARALEDNQGDALVAGLAISTENAEVFDFSTIYLAFPGRFVTAAAAAPTFDPARLAGKTIAVRRDSTHAEFLRRYLPGSSNVGFDSEIAALDALASGAVDAFFGDGLRASFWLNQHLECCAFAGPPFFRPDLFGDGLAMALPAGHDTVRLALDYGLTRLRAGGGNRGGRPRTAAGAVAPAGNAARPAVDGPAGDGGDRDVSAGADAEGVNGEW